MEACGHYPWFERLLAELGHELWLGDAARIRAKMVRRQKTDRRDAEHLLHLLLDPDPEQFPRIWVPSLEERDVRQLLVHRHKQVVARTQVKNQLQAMAPSQGVQKKWKLWTQMGRAELEQLPLLSYAAERRRHLLLALDGLEAEIDELNRRVEEEVRKRLAAMRLQTHPGSGAGDGAGHGADAGTGGALRFGQGSGELLRTDSERAFQRRAAALGTDQQAGQFVSALLAGGSGPIGGPLRRRVRTLLSPPGGAQTSRPGQSRGGAQAGRAVVPDVARRLELRATVQGRCAGEPESFCGWAAKTDRLSGQPASPKSGEFAVTIMGARTEEMDGGTLRPLPD